MKRLALLLTLLIPVLLISQPCLPDGIIFTAQTEIDSFQINYPNCTEIEGAVTISGNNITNLNGLSVLTSIKNQLSIDSCISLTSLTGLENLESIEQIWILNNPSLLNLQGFPNDSISFYFLGIVNNDALTSLSGLEGVKTVFNLFIGENDALVSLSGLENLTKIELLMGWGSGLQIIDNDALINLTGLEGLTSFGNSGGGWPTGIRIEDNDVLNSLEGIDNIEGWTIHNLHIKRNPSLSTCDIQSICDYLASPINEVEIYNNAPGCNSQAEVDTACKYSFVGEISILDKLLIHPNPFNQTVTIEYELQQPAKIQITIYNHLGKQVDIIQQFQQSGKQSLQWQPQGLPPGMYYFTMKAGEHVATEKMVLAR